MDSPAVSCSQAQILYTVAALQKRKRQRQPTEAQTMVSEMHTRTAGDWKAGSGVRVRSEPRHSGTGQSVSRHTSKRPSVPDCGGGEPGR